MLTALFVAARIVANPIANVYQKQLAHRGAQPLFVIGITHLLLTVAVLPFAGFTGTGIADFWTSMGAAAVLAVAGNALLVYALRASDLSLLGPINAYKAVLSLVLGVFLVREIPSVAGLAGVLLILAGSWFVVDRATESETSNAFVRFFRERGVQLRFAALVCSATEAVFLKRAILASTPLTTFAWWVILGVPVATIAAVLVHQSELGLQSRVVTREAPTYLRLALATGVMQASTLLTFGVLQVGYSLALFQLSTVISVWLGWRYFNEPNIRRRFLGSVVMVAGATLIVLSG